MNHLNTLEHFRHRRVLVVGEAMLDRYVYGETHRLCREAPVPVVAETRRAGVAGGAANAAVNAAALGASVTFLSVTGDDDDAQGLVEALEPYDVTPHLVRDPARRTLVKERVFAGSQMLLRLDRGSTQEVTGTVEQELTKRLESLWTFHDAVIISDYGYGVLTDGVLETLKRLQASEPKVLVADAKDLSRYKEVGVRAAKPNYEEAVRLLRLAPQAEGRAEQLGPYASALLDRSGADIVALTLDTEGCLLIQAGGPPYRTYARAQPNTQATGAGDTFVSALTLALVSSAEATAAAEIAAAAAAIVVGRGGTTTCPERELRGYLSGVSKRLPLESLLARLDYLRSEGRRVVFTNGCFDLLHRGHVTYLSQAKALGDVLVVGLNADESVRRLKGATRPVNTLEDRAAVLSGLSCVDHVVSFQKDTPEDLIRLVKPDVYVKGGDYTLETLPEAPLVQSLGGRVELLTYLPDLSTSDIIARVKTGAGRALGAD